MCNARLPLSPASSRWGSACRTCDAWVRALVQDKPRATGAHRISCCWRARPIRMSTDPVFSRRKFDRLVLTASRQQQQPRSTTRGDGGVFGSRGTRSSPRTLPGEGSRADSGPEATMGCPEFAQRDSERGAVTGRAPRDRGLFSARRGRAGARWLLLRVAARLPGAGTEDRPWLSSCALRR